MNSLTCVSYVGVIRPFRPEELDTKLHRTWYRNGRTLKVLLRIMQSIFPNRKKISLNISN